MYIVSQFVTCEEGIESMVDVSGDEERSDEEAQREDELEHEECGEIEGKAHGPMLQFASETHVISQIHVHFHDTRELSAKMYNGEVKYLNFEANVSGIRIVDCKSQGQYIHHVVPSS